MSEPIALQISQRGVVTLPKSLRDTYQLRTGDVLTLIDLGGVFVLSPRRSEVDRMANQISQELNQSGEALESMLAVLREERKKYDSAK